jgi:hypothetical protein
MSAPDKLAKPDRILTTEEVRAELARIRPGAADPLNEAVAGHAARSREDPRELLNEAIQRALTTRAIPADVPFDKVLAEIARSVASSINISRHRTRQHVVDLPIEEIVDLLPAGGYVVTAPDDIIEQERIRDLCIDALTRLAQDDPKIEALLDGIGQRLRGDELMRAVGISKRELATMRKALKRSVKRIWPEVQEKIGAS